MRVSSSSDLDGSLGDSYQRTAIADFARNDPLPSISSGVAAKERWVTACANTTTARSRAYDVVATQAALV